MNIKRSLLFNYSAQIYSALITIIVLPFYISRMGGEGFGLMGFYLMLQAWAQILDAGVGGSLSRQTSITKTNKAIFKKFIKQFYIVVAIFFVIAVLFFTVAYLGRTYVASTWLNSNLNQQVLEVSLVAMFSTLVFRYLLGPFRSGLIGLEKHGVLSFNTIIFMSLRFPIGLLVLDMFDNSLIHYFIYQALVAFIEFLVIALLFVANSRKALINAKQQDNEPCFDDSLKSLLIFSAQLSMLSITWVIVTQIDKLVLSKYIGLEEFGYYTLAVAVSGAIMILSAPLSQILMPRLSTFVVQKRELDYIDVYIKSFTGLSIFVISIASFMVIFSERLLFIWTGDSTISAQVYPFVKWLVLGNAISVMMNFIFILQYSMGRLRQHVIAYLTYSLLLIPISIYITYHYKAMGAAVFWFVHNLVFFILWGTIVHRKYLQGISSYLWGKVLLPSVIISTSYLYLVKSLVIFYDKSLIDFALLFLIGLCNVIILLVYFWFFNECNNKYINKLRFSSSF